MSRVHQDFEDLIATGPSALSNFSASLDPEWIHEALRATGKASMRRRKLPAEAAVWLVIGTALFSNRSIIDVAEALDLVLPDTQSVAPSAVHQARYRLGAEPLAYLFDMTAASWSKGEQGYKDLGLFALDCVCMRVPDSDANYEHFGKPGGRGGSSDAGYPQLRMACLLNVETRMLVDAEFGPYATSEHELAEQLWSSVPDQSLTLLDRGFINYKTFAELQAGGENRHFLVRMRANLKVQEVEELPDGSLRVLMRPTRAVLTANPELPDQIEGRLVAYQHDGGKPSRIFTTLLDHERYPAKELVELYHKRWEIELAYDEVKTHMLDRKESLRSKRPEGINQEVYGILLAYNIVRREMAIAAKELKVAPNRISFQTSLMLLRDLFFLAATTKSPGALPRHIKDMRLTFSTLLLPERRSKRRYPRHVKIKMSNFKRNRGKRHIEGA